MKKIVFGLGNPGDFYKYTRHNLGANVIHEWWALADRESISSVEKVDLEFQMNESGDTLLKKLKNTPYESKNILVAHDDIELAFGEVELVFGGSAKGHNGVRSVYEALGSQDIWRLRLGVGRPMEGVDVKDFVLKEFNAIEKQGLKMVQEKAKGLIEKFINSNFKAQMPKQ